MLRMIYKKHIINVPTTPAACGGTGSSVKRSENWSRPIPSIGLGRQTTTIHESIPLDSALDLPVSRPASHCHTAGHFQSATHCYTARHIAQCVECQAKSRADD